jgi:hypothetical protein
MENDATFKIISQSSELVVASGDWWLTETIFTLPSEPDEEIEDDAFITIVDSDLSTSAMVDSIIPLTKPKQKPTNLNLQQDGALPINSFQVTPANKSTENLTLSLPTTMDELLTKLVDKTHLPVEQIISQGIIFIDIAIKAKENGLRLMIVDEKGDIVTEIVDFGEE